ncbi:MAG TPA: PAS domain-containing protein, partial [Solirubrobacteraceae bacterium]|nr:PAS domain-containing protein [Solirubrobacteraceae bacterium]
MRSPIPNARAAAVTNLERLASEQPSAAPAPDDEARDLAVAGDQRIARLFEMTSDLLATISLDGRFTLLNPAWEQVLGWTREELQAKPIQEYLHPDDVDQTLALLLTGNHRPAHL